MNLPRRLLREHFSACGAGALHPPFCRQSKWQKLPWMLAVSKMAGAKPEGCNSWRESFVFQTKQLNLDKDEV